MSVATKALWIMERNSDRPLSLNGLAEATGVSRSHLALAFGSTFGMPVMAYLRARRLGRAAEVLANGAPDILAVALDAGYGSHEAFTRAFREQFGVTPESVRQRGSVEGLALVDAAALEPTNRRPPLRPTFVEHGEIVAVGLSAPYTFGSTIGIPAQWQRFMSVCDEIEDQSAEIPIGINSVPNDEGAFNYSCAVEVERFGTIPKGLEAIRIAPARYAIFEHNGHVSSLYDTYSRIWNEALPALGLVCADAPIVEHHNPTFNTMTGEGGLTLWVPVVPAPASASERNRETVESYGRYAQKYAEATKEMSAHGRAFLDKFAATLPPNASVLEVGSGPGWDADYLEAKGLKVRRTDAAAEFVAMQRARGKEAAVLDLIEGDLGRDHDGVLVMYVLQHIDDAVLSDVLRKIAASLKPGGTVLLTYREGDELLTEHSKSGEYHSTLRRPAAFREALAQVGLTVDGEDRHGDEDGVWQVVFARR